MLRLTQDCPSHINCEIFQMVRDILNKSRMCPVWFSSEEELEDLIFPIPLGAIVVSVFNELHNAEACRMANKKIPCGDELNHMVDLFLSGIKGSTDYNQVDFEGIVMSLDYLKISYQINPERILIPWYTFGPSNSYIFNSPQIQVFNSPSETDGYADIIINYFGQENTHEPIFHDIDSYAYENSNQASTTLGLNFNWEEMVDHNAKIND